MGVINENVVFLQNRIRNYQQRIRDLQAQCPHDIVAGYYKGNTGNWCPQDDRYWIEAECQECLKYIHADSDTELYRKLSRSGMIK